MKSVNSLQSIVTFCLFTVLLKLDVHNTSEVKKDVYFIKKGIRKSLVKTENSVLECNIQQEQC